MSYPKKQNHLREQRSAKFFDLAGYLFDRADYLVVACCAFAIRRCYIFEHICLRNLLRLAVAIFH